MEHLLDRIWNADGMAQACIMLSTLIPTSVPEGRKNRPLINSQYRDLVKRRWNGGKCIYLAEMSPAEREWLDLQGDDFLPDSVEEQKVHPSVWQPVFLILVRVAANLPAGQWPQKDGSHVLPSY